MFIAHSRPGSVGEASFGGPLYRGPADGRSSKPKSWVRPTAATLANLTSRFSVEGLENVPDGGGNIFCPNHPALSLDLYIPHLLSRGDLRTMLRIEKFQSGPSAAFSKATGAYPVDRDSPSSLTKAHTVDLLREGKDALLFPEGRFSEVTGKVGPLKRGAASFAYKGAKTVVPVALHYQKDEESRWGETLLAAAGSTALGALAGGGGAGLAGCALGVALGSKLGRWAARLLVPRIEKNEALAKRFQHDPIVLAGASFVGGALGGAVGALAGAACALPAAVAVGLGAFSVMKDYIHRPIVKVKVGEPIDVEPYRQMDKREANTALTEALHSQLGSLVSDLSGVPYSRNEPKIFQGQGNPESQS